MSLSCLNETSDGVIFYVLAAPRASRTEISELRDDYCKIKVKAPPVDGEANTALIQAIAKWFGLPKKSVIQQKGFTGKQKVFLLSGLSLDKAETILNNLLDRN